MNEMKWLNDREWRVIREALRHAMRTMDECTDTLFVEWPDEDLYNVYCAMNSECVRINNYLDGGDDHAE